MEAVLNNIGGIELSVVIPVFNEAENIGPLCRELIPVLDALGRGYEVLIVDDGSTDGSMEKLMEQKTVFPALRVIQLPSNRGQSAALAAGFRFAAGRLIVTMDGDLQTDSGDIPRLLRYAEEFSLVIGRRYPRHDPAWKNIQATIANKVRSAVLKDTIRDIGSPLRVFRRSDVTRIPLFNGFHRFLPILLAAKGCTVRQVTVNHRPRRMGRTKYGMLDRVFRAIIDMWAVKWMINRSLKEEGKEVI
jgi:glycosyltransferase involved in cell wall biosynthesis